jgi:hypothetical protein
MSSFSKEFDGVTIRPDGSTVRVDGTSKMDGAAYAEPVSAEIYVAIVDLPDHQPLLARAVLSGPAWSATFPHAAPPLKDMQIVRVLGVGLCLTQPPFVWEQFVEVTSRVSG